MIRPLVNAVSVLAGLVNGKRIGDSGDDNDVNKARFKDLLASRIEKNSPTPFQAEFVSDERAFTSAIENLRWSLDVFDGSRVGLCHGKPPDGSPVFPDTEHPEMLFWKIRSDCIVHYSSALLCLFEHL